MTDKLTDMVYAQTNFMDRLNVPRLMSDGIMEEQFDSSAHAAEVQKFIPQIMFALVCELGEIGDEINWKHWKKTKREVNHKNLRMELIDAFHFLLEIMIMCGMNADSIHQGYFNKMAENNRRQNDGY